MPEPTPTPTPTPTPVVPVAEQLTKASLVAANDTAVNSTASFVVLQDAGVPAVVVASPPKVNFAVFSDGAVKKDITVTGVSVIIAKLIPGTNGNPDRWESYTYRKETATATVGPNGKAALASAMQATSDPKQTDAALLAQQLVLHADGYYTYTFRTDIKDPAQTNGVTFEPGLTHRVALQLSYVNAAGETVRVNPYFDFTLDASGKSVPVTDAAKTRKMVDIGTCNGCHNKLALHGGGRVDTQFCVMCHNPGTVDANSGNNVNMATMIHKIHSGRELHLKGENYVIWGNRDSKHDYSEVGFPQPTRNCVACHDGSNPKTPQGDNWKKVPSKEACLTCHQTGATSGFFATHVTTLKLGASADAIPNSTCNNCHAVGSNLSAEKVHWVQEMANYGNYQVRIESVSLKQAATSTAAGTMTVKYSIMDPKSGGRYNLREGCNNGTATTDQAGKVIPLCNTNYRWDVTTQASPNPGRPQDKFGTFTVYLATETVAGVTLDDVTNTTSFAAYRGVADANGMYTADLAIPAGSRGNARVMIIGSVAERRLDPVTRNPVGAVPPKENKDLAYVPVQNAIYDVNVATGAASTTPRRAIVKNDNCNSCHGYLGLPTHADPNKPGFHKGVRNNADGCNICHNANQAGSYTLMADNSKGTVVGDQQTAIVNAATSSNLHESYQAKRFVHGIHYGSVRTYPFTHCLNVAGEWNKDGTSKIGGPKLGAETCVNQYLGGETLNFSAEVAYPGATKACANCHVNDSWKDDKSVIGTVVFKPTGVSNMLDWLVISPKAATCTTCHDAKSVQTHVKTVGAAFGNATQRNLLLEGKVFESCEGCHAPGTALGVDKAHAYK